MAEEIAPLVPAEVDLRGDVDFMPLYGDRLFKSESWKKAGYEARCAMLRLWWHSFAHEAPAASLPNDDMLLADYAGYGDAVGPWMKVREQALRHWVTCADGRLYDPVLAPLAIEVWESFRSASAKGKLGAAKRWGKQRHPPDIAQASLLDSSSYATATKNDGNGQGYGHGDSSAPPNGRSRRSARSPVPESFEVTPDMAAWAVDRGLPRERIESETLKFLNHHKGKGSLQADWVATWRTWILRGVDMGARH